MDNTLFNLEASSYLLSTNPKLTTNVKLVCDSKYNIYMSSFSAVNELSTNAFKRFKINSKSEYAKDLFSFYQQGKFPKRQAYSVFEQSSNMNILRDFDKQYDGMYKAGAEFKDSKLYEEKISILAPIWLKKKLPSYFVVYRLEGYDYENFDIDVLQKATIVKTFDLSNRTTIGRYLRKHMSKVPYSPISLDFTKDKMSYINGIDYNSGTITSKGFYAYEDYVMQDKTVIQNDEYITGLFEDHNMIVANLINMEFLFDDDTVNEYSLNRYVGFYVDEIEEGDFLLDIDTIYRKKGTQQEISPADINNIKDKLLLSGSYNTTIYIKDLKTETGFPEFDKIRDLRSFFYIKDVDGNFYSLCRRRKWSNNELHISNKDLNLKKFDTTISDNSFVDVDLLRKEAQSHVVINVKRGFPDTFGIKIYDGDLLVTEVYADNTLTEGTVNPNGIYFVSQGKTKTIARSLASIIDVNGGNLIKAKSIDDNVIIYSKFFGKRFNGIRIELLTRGTNKDLYMQLHSNDGYFIGGSDVNNYRYLIKDEDANVFKQKKVIVGAGYEDATQGFYINGSKNDFYNYRTVILESEPSFSNKQITLIDLYRTKYGRFNIYPIKDFDTDYHSNDYKLDYELEKEKDYYSDTTNQDISNFYLENNLYELSDNNTNEYDVYQENNNKDYAVKSRVVPYTNKWIYKDGTDSRNRDYRLNLSYVFGTYNSVPSDIIREQDIKAYTHEWFYIDKVPDFYEKEDYEKSYSYVDSDNYLLVDDDYFLDVENDNFSEYFTSDSFDGDTLSKNRLLFTTFENGKNNLQYPESFFKGLKVTAKEKKVYKKTNYNLNNIEFNRANSEKLNGYKFSTVLVNDLDFFHNENYKIKVVKNDKFKTITMIIITNIDYNQKLDKTLLYSLKSKYTETNDFEDVIMKGTIDLETTRFLPTGSLNISGSYYIIKGIPDKDGVETNFVEQIKVNKEGKFFSIYFDYKGVGYRIYDIFKILTTNTLYARKFVKIEGGVEYNLTRFPIVKPTKRDMTYLNYDETNSNGLIVERGGYNSYQNIINDLSFANISKDINLGNPDVEYTSINESGEITKDDFVIEINIPDVAKRFSEIEKTTDDDKPIKFNFVDIIGYNIKEKESKENIALYRHEGDFIPKMKDVFSFINPHTLDHLGDEYKEKIYNLTKYLNTNVSNIESLNNMYYHKVTRENYSILELESDSNYESLYPLIDEIAIDYKDIDIFKTNWGNDYYYNYSDKGVRNPYITRAEKETKSYFGSKVMRVPNDIYFDNTLYEFSDIDNVIEIDVNVEEMLRNHFKTYIKIIPNEEELESYINNNLLKIYETAKVDLYTREINGNGTVNLDYMSRTDAERQGFNMRLNLNYTLINVSDLNIKIQFNKTYGKDYYFGLSINTRIK